MILAGLFMMLIAAYVVGKPLLVGKASTGLYTFDAVKFMSNLMGTRAGGMGMIIMSAGGFAKYMDHIGASKTLVNICTKPLSILKSPYMVLGPAYIIGQILNIFIPSASGLGMLLMVTILPILTSLGVSRLSATAVICSCFGLDLGPASGNSNLAAKNAGLDSAIYFAEYQIPLAIIVVCSIVMGSANAPFFAFAALVPQVATKIGMSPVIMLLPMQFASSLARNLSPITGVVVAVCGLANVNPMDLMKRTYIPMSISILVTVVATVLIFH